jgi:predicted MFS family arabinose efflux permease
MPEWQQIALVAGGAGLLIGIILARRSHQEAPILTAVGHVFHYLAGAAVAAVPFGVLISLVVPSFHFRIGVQVALVALGAAIVLVILHAIPESIARRKRPDLKRNFLGVAWDRWALLSKPIGDFNARVLMGLFYFTFLVPFGLLNRLTSDRLRLKKAPEGQSLWMSREPALDLTIEDARRQS